MLLSNIPWELFLFTIPVGWVINRFASPYRDHNYIADFLSCAKCVGLWMGLFISIGYFFGNIQENFVVILAFSVWNSVLSYIFALIVYFFERLAEQ